MVEKMIIFDGILEAASDRARFLAIMLSALFILIGVWYTQRQTNKRESKALRLSKVEELYKASTNYRQTINHIRQSAYSSPNTKPFSSLQEDLQENRKDIGMYISLYFPTEEMDRSTLPARMSAMNGVTNSLQFTKNLIENTSILDDEARYHVSVSIKLAKQINDEDCFITTKMWRQMKIHLKAPAFLKKSNQALEVTTSSTKEDNAS